MKVLAVLQADLDVTTIGTKSRLALELAGVPVLRRTVMRISRAESIGGVHVLAPADQVERCRQILQGTGAVVRADDLPPAPWSSLVRSARKWSLASWRGGIGQTTVFDEFVDCRRVARVLDQESADAVLVASPAGVLVDCALTDAMIEQMASDDRDARLVFTQTPPGLSGILLATDFVRELADKQLPVGWTMSYQPDEPRKDLIFESCYCESPTELRHAGGRMIADTVRAHQCLAALLDEHEDPDGRTVGRWLTQRQNKTAETLPREVEIELTTADPYPNTLVRPRGERVPSRGPIDPSLVGRVAQELSAFDDSLVVLGGFGDPLRHPALAEVLTRLRPAGNDGAGIYGVAVRTSAADLDEEKMSAIVSSGVDVLDVTLDAWTPELYARLHDPPGDETSRSPETARPDLALVLANLEKLAAVQRDRGAARPIVVPGMTKMRENVCELDDFFDGWLRKKGAVSVSGYSHHAGQCDDRAVIGMAPAARSPCRRVRERCLILADGRVVMCDQDFKGVHALESLHERSLQKIWQGQAFESLRSSHRQGNYDCHPLCTACDDWHRP